MLTLSELLKDLREKRAISKRELERRTGIARTSILAYESGRYVPSVQVLKKIFAALGVSFEVLDQCTVPEDPRSKTKDSEGLKDINSA